MLQWVADEILKPAIRCPWSRADSLEGGRTSGGFGKIWQSAKALRRIGYQMVIENRGTSLEEWTNVRQNARMDCAGQHDAEIWILMQDVKWLLEKMRKETKCKRIPQYRSVGNRTIWLNTACGGKYLKCAAKRQDFNNSGCKAQELTLQKWGGDMERVV